MTSFRFATISDDERARPREQLARAQPFPHPVLEDVLTVDAGDVVDRFPPPEWTGWTRFHDAYQAGKMYCQDVDAIPPPLAALIAELNGPPFLAFLETITGIRALLPDPYLEGGG